MKSFGPYTKRIFSFVSGKVTGLLAGIFGVGGGEFRIPILSFLIDSIKIVVTLNLLVGIFSVVFSTALRFAVGIITTDILIKSIYLSLGSVVGAYLGTIIGAKLPEKFLKRLIAIYLAIVGVRFILVPWLDMRFSMVPTDSLIFIFMILLGIGIISSIPAPIFGIAGGEIRIPLLIILLGMNVKEAGTLSLLASISTLVTALLDSNRKYDFEVGHYDIAASMTLGSLVGIFFGVLVLIFSPDRFLKFILGIVLLVATLRFIPGVSLRRV